MKKFFTFCAAMLVAFAVNAQTDFAAPGYSCAADDAVLGPYAAEEIKECLKDDPDTEIYSYDGYGHVAFDTAPDYTERLFEFLTK